MQLRILRCRRFLRNEQINLRKLDVGIEIQPA